MSAPDAAERFARLRLARAERVGPVTFRQLLDRFGGATAALEALPALVRRAGGQGFTAPPVDRIEVEMAAGEAVSARLYGDR